MFSRNFDPQEGYSVALLEEASNPQIPDAPAVTVHSRKPVHPPENSLLQEEKVPPIPVNEFGKYDIKRPFWRTTKGLAIIAVITVVIIGAIVGGAVGGTVSRKNKNSIKGSGGLPESLPSSKTGPTTSTVTVTASTTGFLQSLSSLLPRPSSTTPVSGSGGGGPNGGNSGNGSGPPLNNTTGSLFTPKSSLTKTLAAGDKPGSGSGDVAN